MAAVSRRATTADRHQLRVEAVLHPGEYRLEYVTG
jgi:hypothetical protein